MAIIKLDSHQTQQLLRLEARPPGTYELQTLIQGNSLLSTVFVKTMAGGATFKVNYYETTTGSDFGEREELPGHDLISVASSDPDYITVTPFHNTPKLEAIVTGGIVDFSVQVTVVDSFATDLDAALKKDQQIVDISNDKGIPTMCYDETTGLWNFIRCDAGGLLVNFSEGTPFHDQGNTSCAVGSTALTSFVVPAATTRKLTTCNISSAGQGFFTLTEDASIIAMGRTMPGSPNVFYPFRSTKNVPTGSTVALKYDLVAGQPSPCDVFWSVQANDF